MGWSVKIVGATHSSKYSSTHSPCKCKPSHEKNIQKTPNCHVVTYILLKNSKQTKTRRYTIRKYALCKLGLGFGYDLNCVHILHIV